MGQDLLGWDLWGRDLWGGSMGLGYMGRELWGESVGQGSIRMGSMGQDLWGGIYGAPHSHPARTPLLWGWECNMGGGYGAGSVEWIYGAGSMGQDLWGGIYGAGICGAGICGVGSMGCPTATLSGPHCYGAGSVTWSGSMGRDLWGGIYGAPHSHPARTPLLWGWECNMGGGCGAGSVGRIYGVGSMGRIYGAALWVSAGVGRPIDRCRRKGTPRASAAHPPPPGRGCGAQREGLPHRNPPCPIETPPAP